MATREDLIEAGYRPMTRNAFDTEASRQADALERIAAALEVLAMSAMWRDNGGDAEAGFATSINIAAGHFREARDA